MKWDEEAFADAFPAGAVKVAEANYAGNWEGSGAAIAKLNGRYYVMEYSHCSCYGPEDSMQDGGDWPTYEDARRAISSTNLSDIPETEPSDVA